MLRQQFPSCSRNFSAQAVHLDCTKSQLWQGQTNDCVDGCTQFSKTLLASLKPACIGQGYESDRQLTSILGKRGMIAAEADRRRQQQLDWVDRHSMLQVRLRIRALVKRDCCKEKSSELEPWQNSMSISFSAPQGISLTEKPQFWLASKCMTINFLQRATSTKRPRRAPFTESSSLKRKSQLELAGTIYTLHKPVVSRGGELKLPDPKSYNCWQAGLLGQQSLGRQNSAKQEQGLSIVIVPQMVWPCWA